MGTEGIDGSIRQALPETGNAGEFRGSSTLALVTFAFGFNVLLFMLEAGVASYLYLHRIEYPVNWILLICLVFSIALAWTIRRLERRYNKRLLLKVSLVLVAIWFPFFYYFMFMTPFGKLVLIPDGAAQ